MASVVTRRQTSTRGEIRQEVLRAFGGYVELVDSADTTSVIVGEMKYRFGNDNRGVGWGIYLPDQATNTEARQRITAWDDSAGDATVDTMAETPGAGETVEYYPPGDPGPDAINEAIDQAMRRHSRTVWSTIPTRDTALRYDLGMLDWMEHADQVVGVYRRQSPNMLTNPSFETWGSGGGPAVAEWALAGTSATVTRVAGRLDGFAAQLARVGANARLRQDLTPLLADLRGTYGAAAYTNPLAVTFGLFAKTATAAMARATVSDGVSTGSTGLHTGGNTWEFLSASYTFQTTATTFTLDAECVTNNGNADFDDAIVVEGTALATADIEHGDQQYVLQDVDATVTLEGTRPSLRLRSPLPRGGQLVVATQQPYFVLTAEGDVTDMPLEAAAAFTIVTLLERFDPGVAQDRYNALRQLWEPRARRWALILTQNPSPAVTSAQIVATGAR